MRRRANAAYVTKSDTWMDRGWTAAPNSVIRDPDMPMELVGVYVWLASHTDEFEVSGQVLWKAKNGLGRNRAYAMLGELERLGLLTRTHHIDPDQNVPFVLYHLEPEPVPEEQRTWTPSAAKPRKKTMPPKQQVKTGFPDGRETAPEGTGNTDSRTVGKPSPTTTFPDGREQGGTSRTGGSRTGGKPYKEENTIVEKHSLTHSASEPPVADDAGRTERGIPSRGENPAAAAPSEMATVLVAELDYGTLPRPSKRELAELATLVDAAVTSGRDLTALAMHLQARLARAKTNPAAYLRFALADDELPMPAQPAQAPKPVGSTVPPVCGECDARPGDPVSARIEWLDTDRTEQRLCRRCHPNALRAVS